MNYTKTQGEAPFDDRFPLYYSFTIQIAGKKEYIRAGAQRTRISLEFHSFVHEEV